jgi:hypothetical protein
MSSPNASAGAAKSFGGVEQRQVRARVDVFANDDVTNKTESHDDEDRRLPCS